LRIKKQETRLALHEHDDDDGDDDDDDDYIFKNIKSDGIKEGRFVIESIYI